MNKIIQPDTTMTNKLTIITPYEEIEVNKFSVNKTYLGESLLTFSLQYFENEAPEFSLDWYCFYDGIKYVNTSPEPSAKKTNKSLLYEFSLVFEPEYERLLKNNIFIDIVDENDLGRALYDYNFSFATTLSEFVERFRLNLFYYYGDKFKIDLNPQYQYSEFGSTVTANSTNLWDAIALLYSAYNTQFHFEYDGDTIVVKIGYDIAEIDHTFKYRDGILGITRSNNTENVITALRVRGTKNNLPVNYLSNRYSDQMLDVDAATEFKYGVGKLLPYSARLSIRGWNDAKNNKIASSAEVPYLWGYKRYKNAEAFDVYDFILSDNIDKFGVRWGTMDDVDAVKPSLQGKSVAGLGRLDEIVAVEEIYNDDYEGLYKPFEVELPDNGFTWTFYKNSLIGDKSRYNYKIKGDEFYVAWDNPIVTTKVALTQTAGSASITFSYKATLRRIIPNTPSGRPSSEIIYVTQGVLTPSVSSGTLNNIVIDSGLAEKAESGTYYVEYEIYIPEYQSLDNLSENNTFMCNLVSCKVSAQDNIYNEFKKTFDIWVKDLGFNPGDKQWWPVDGTEMSVMFSSGLLAGEDREFRILQEVYDSGEVASLAVVEDNSKSILTTDVDGSPITVRSKYKITLEKIYPEDELLKVLPSSLINAKAGEYFFLVNLQMPYDPYVYLAEQELLALGKEHLSQIDDDIITYGIDLSRIFDGEAIDTSLYREGARFRLLNETLIGEAYETLYINSISIDYGKSILPEVKLTTSNTIEPQKGTIASLKSEIKQLSIGAGNAPSQVLSNFVVEIGNDRFIRKDISDIVNGEITFNRNTIFKDSVDIVNGDLTVIGGDIDNVSGITKSNNFQTRNFTEGQFAGTGVGIKSDSNGNGVVETDHLVVRRSIKVNETIINQVTFESGNKVLSAASMECSEVEVISGNAIASIADVSLESTMGWATDGIEIVDFEDRECMKFNHYNSIIGSIVPSDTYLFSIDIFTEKSGGFFVGSEEDLLRYNDITAITNNNNLFVIPDYVSGTLKGGVEYIHYADSEEGGRIAYRTADGTIAATSVGMPFTPSDDVTIIYGTSSAPNTTATIKNLVITTSDKFIDVPESDIGNWARVSKEITITEGNIVIAGGLLAKTDNPIYLSRVKLSNDSVLDIEPDDIYTDAESAFYRCFMDTHSGSKLNTFKKNDLAYCQRFDETFSEIIKFYWLPVISVGVDYIDLALNQGIIIEGQLPSANDNIVQLGNLTDRERQGAIVYDIIRESGPMVNIYANINDFSLSEKNYMGAGVTDGQAELYAYGKSYIGNRDRSQYVEYVDGKLEVKAVLRALSGSNVGQPTYTSITDPIILGEQVMEGSQWIPEGTNRTFTYFEDKGWVPSGSDTQTSIDGGVITTGALIVGDGTGSNGMYRTLIDSAMNPSYEGSYANVQYVIFSPAEITKDTNGIFSGQIIFSANSTYWPNNTFLEISFEDGILSAKSPYTNRFYTATNFNILSSAIIKAKGLAGITGSDPTNNKAPRFYAGADDPNQAPFRVLQDGSFLATKADIRGTVVATNGSFTGEVYSTKGTFQSPPDINAIGNVSLVKIDNLNNAGRVSIERGSQSFGIIYNPYDAVVVSGGSGATQPFIEIQNESTTGKHSVLHMDSNVIAILDSDQRLIFRVGFNDNSRSLTINANYLPTEMPTTSGTLYVDENNFLKIS